MSSPAPAPTTSATPCVQLEVDSHGPSWQRRVTVDPIVWERHHRRWRSRLIVHGTPTAAQVDRVLRTGGLEGRI